MIPYRHFLVTLLLVIISTERGTSGEISLASSGGPGSPDWFTGQYPKTAPIPLYDPASTYSGQAQARDSYVDAANDVSSQPAGQALRYHYQMYPADNSGSYKPTQDQRVDYSGSSGQGMYNAPAMTYGTGNQEWQWEEEEGNSMDNIGLLGLLGLKGLKGVKALKPLLLALLLLPLLPFKLLLLAGLLVLLLFIPVPVVTVPNNNGRFLTASARELKHLALSEDCLERISCEATRFAKGYGFNAAWVQEFLDKNPNPNATWIERVSKGIKSADCATFSCNPSTILRKSFKATIGGTESTTLEPKGASSGTQTH